MTDVKFSTGHLDENHQQLVNAGFTHHTKERLAPPFQKNRINWLAFENDDILVGALTAEGLRDWV